MAATRSWKIYGAEGHRQKMSFGKSELYDWSMGGKIRMVEMLCEDKTKTNDYVVIRITRDTPEECVKELEGQLSDGFFENCRYGSVVEI